MSNLMSAHWARMAGTAALAGLLLAGGCSSSSSAGGSLESSSIESAAGADRDSRIAVLEQELANRESRITRLEDQLTAANNAVSSPTSTMGGAGSDLFPPNARAGECYARVLSPARYSASEERVLVKEASERFEYT